MLEQLGLGVTLTLQDNFTPGANSAMQSFNRLESQAQKTAQNVSRSMMSLQNVMLAGFSFAQVGNSIENLGKQVIGVFTGLEKKMISVNSQFDTIGAQFKTIFGDSNAKKMMDWSTQFAITTPYTMGETAKAVQGISAVGLDVTQQFKSANGEMKSFLEYVGDLATRNMSAMGGMEGMKIAISNAVSGQAGGLKSLQARFDIPKAELAKLSGKTGVAFEEAFAKLADKLTPNAMRNMVGTWEQMISEMQDTWDVFLWRVGKTGVFDEAKLTLKSILVALRDITNQKGAMDNLKNLFQTLWKPVDLAVQGLIKLVYAFNTLATYHPKLALLVEQFVAFGGILMIVSGFLMKTVGSVLILGASIGSLLINLKLMNMMAMETDVALAGVRATATGILGTFGALAIVGAGLFLGWKNDVMGLRTKTENFFDSLKKGYEYAKSYLNGGMDIFNRNVKIKLNIPPLVTFFAEKFVKIIALTKAFWEIMNGVFHGGVMSITKDNYEMYKRAGILEYVHALIYTKDKINAFFEGFAKGLSSVYVIGKNLLDIVLRPMFELIKPITDAIGGIVGLTSYGKTSYKAQDAYVDFMGSGDNQSKYDRLKTDSAWASSAEGQAFKARQTELYNNAQKEMQKNNEIGDKVRGQVSMFGQGLGLATGALASFYVVSKLIGKLSPFKSSMGDFYTSTKLSNSVKDRRAFEKRNPWAEVLTEEEIARRAGIDLGDKGKPFSATARARAMNYLRSIDNTAKGGYSLHELDGAYRNLRSEDVYGNYYNHFLKDQLGSNQLQVKRRSGIMKFLMGEDYYGKNTTTGERTKLGRWGGILRTPWDDEQMKLRATDIYARTGVVSDFTSLFNAQRRITAGDPLGTVANLKNTPFAQANRNIAVPYIAKIKQYQGEIEAIERAKQVLDNSLKNGSTKGASELMKLIGYSGGRPRNSSDWQNLFNEANIAQDIRSTKIFGQRSMLSQASMANRNALHANIYADTEQSALSRLLFGQHLYTATQNADGTYTRQNVARRGGIFRSRASDYNYLDPEAHRFANTRVGQAFGRVRGGLSGWASNAGAEFGSEMSSIRGALAGSMIGRAFGRAGRGVGAVRGWGRTQLNRVGLGGARVGLMGGAGWRGALNRVGAGTMALGRGAIGTAGRLGRGALLGAGMLGRGFMGMLPGALMLGALGTSAVSAIRGKGKEVSEGRGTGMQQFNAGLNYYKQQMAKVNLSAMWADFKKNGGSTFNIIGSMFKTMAQKMGVILPDIMKTAWQGIKAMASIAWVWIKGDGIKLMGNLATTIVSLIGKGFTWLGANAGKIFGGLATFVIGTVVPAMISGVVKLGAFIITHIPSILKTLVQIGGGILGGLLTIVVGIFKGIGTAVFNAIKGVFSGFGQLLKNILGGAIKAVLPTAVATPILSAFGIHHKGLYMSPNEHTAIIRKDETVLPPEISRKFNDLIVKGGGRGGSGSGGGIHVEKMEIVVKADKLSKSEARQQAIMIAKEFKKLKREKQSRRYEDIDTSGLEFA